MALEQRLPEEAEELKKRRFQIVNVRDAGPLAPPYVLLTSNETGLETPKDCLQGPVGGSRLQQRAGRRPRARLRGLSGSQEGVLHRAPEPGS